ncbi:hypothetical protein AB0K00_34460 [Dactylosporangium sp. NPDC049525]|uniref:hypothetical protein n=1 Tax=Dactylosporangium sp. NPDC049525 TaxID=3154730 RepID=UPI0034135A94
MGDLAPSSAEATAVTVLTAASMLATLGLLVVCRRLRRAPAAARRPTWGLTVVSLIATVLLYFGGRVTFVAAHPGGSATLFELHGRDTPVYWVAYLVGAGLLVVLTGALLKSPDTLRFTVGLPAMLVAVLMSVLLAVLKLKFDRLDARLATAHLPAVKPTDDESDGIVGAYAHGGWVVAVLGVTLLALTVLLVLAGPAELRVLVALVAGVSMVTAPTLLDDDFWALRNGTVERVKYTVFELGGWALLWPAVIVGLAVLLCAIPFLPKWFRGFATFTAVAAPAWIALAVVLAAPLLNEGIQELLRADGYTVSVRRGGAVPVLFMLTPALAVPVAAIRAWRTNRRTTTPTAAHPTAGMA